MGMKISYIMLEMLERVWEHEKQNFAGMDMDLLPGPTGQALYRRGLIMPRLGTMWTTTAKGRALLTASGRA